MRLPRLYAIIDAAQTEGRARVNIVEALLSGGVTLIQYRDKRGSSREVYEGCRKIRGLIRKAGARFIVNDRADVALAVDADGVHVGREDISVEMARAVFGQLEPRPKWIGCSTHNVAQLQEADQTSADYIAFGPIFATRSKENPDPPVGLEGLRLARRATPKPLVAIGGITVENARAVIEAGADSVAVIGDLLKAPDITARAREFIDLLGK